MHELMMFLFFVQSMKMFNFIAKQFLQGVTILFVYVTFYEYFFLFGTREPYQYFLLLLFVYVLLYQCYWFSFFSFLFFLQNDTSTV